MTERERADFGRQVIGIAMAYALFAWQPDERNILHGLDVDGKRIDTPDCLWTEEESVGAWWRPGEINTGVPYAWGGGSTLEAFASAVAAGLPAGNIPFNRRHPISRFAAGVDCSGLLTVCWGLPKKIATMDIPGFADLLPRPEDMLPGDVLAMPGNHVMIFRSFTDGSAKEAVILDAAKSIGRVSQRTVHVPELLRGGFSAYRKP